MPLDKSALDVVFLANDSEATLDVVLIKFESVFIVGGDQLVEVYAIAPIAGEVLPVVLLD